MDSEYLISLFLELSLLVFPVMFLSMDMDIQWVLADYCTGYVYAVYILTVYIRQHIEYIAIWLHLKLHITSF